MAQVSVTISASHADTQRAIDAWQNRPVGIRERACRRLWRLCRARSIEVAPVGERTTRVLATARGPLAPLALRLTIGATSRRATYFAHFGVRPGASTVPSRASARPSPPA